MTARDIGQMVVASSILTVTGGKGGGQEEVSVAATGLQGGCWKVAWGREEETGRGRREEGEGGEGGARKIMKASLQSKNLFYW